MRGLPQLDLDIQISDRMNRSTIVKIYQYHNHKKFLPKKLLKKIYDLVRNFSNIDEINVKFEYANNIYHIKLEPLVNKISKNCYVKTIGDMKHVIRNNLFNLEKSTIFDISKMPRISHYNISEDMLVPKYDSIKYSPRLTMCKRCPNYLDQCEKCNIYYCNECEYSDLHITHQFIFPSSVSDSFNEFAIRLSSNVGIELQNYMSLCYLSSMDRNIIYYVDFDCVNPCLKSSRSKI